jgi:hypothetical protein
MRTVTAVEMNDACFVLVHLFPLLLNFNLSVNFTATRLRQGIAYVAWREGIRGVCYCVGGGHDAGHFGPVVVTDCGGHLHRSAFPVRIINDTTLRISDVWI